MPSLLAWFLYTNLIGALCAGIAWLAERVLERTGRSVRWAWLGGIGLTGLIPALQFGRVWPLVQIAPLSDLDRHIGSAIVSLTGGEVVAAPDGGVTLASDPTGTLLTAWALVTGGALLWLLWSAIKLHKSRRSWIHCAGEESKFFVTQGLGPGVMGVLRQEILLPQWVLGRSDEERKLIWDHEQEHVRAGDNRLLAAGFAPVLLLPWILPLWWQFRRLRVAVELDCDRRVLRGKVSPRRYGELLLDVASGSVLLPVAPFSRRSHTLRRRIQRIASRDGRPTWIYRAAAGAAGVCLLLASLAIPAPGAGVTWNLLPVPLGTYRSTLSPEQPSYTRLPQPLNDAVVESAIQRFYPPSLRAAGQEGRVGLLVHVATDGEVDQVRVAVPSRYPAFNEAARRVALISRYRPATLPDGMPTAVWLFWPIEFRTSR